MRHVWYLVLKLLNFGDCQFHLIDFKQNCNEYGAMLMHVIAFMKRAGDVKVEGSKLGYMMRIRDGIFVIYTEIIVFILEMKKM